MKCLVTGGTGFIGSNLAMQLQRDGHDVIVTGYQAEQKLPGFKGKIIYPSFLGIDWNAIGKVDVVFHEAAITDTTILDRDEMMRVNLESSKELFKRVVANGCKRIVYASSTAVYGGAPAPYKEGVTPMQPLNPYGESKKLLDDFAMQFAKEHPDVTVVGLRYCNVYGPGESHKGKMATQIYQIAQQLVKGNPRVFKHGEQKRDYIYVKDVVRANILASQAKQSCIVNCGGGSTTTFNELIAILSGLLGVQRTTEYIDNPYAAQYQSYTECDMTLAKEKIGFIPQYDIRAGIADYFASGALVPK